MPINPRAWKHERPNIGSITVQHGCLSFLNVTARNGNFLSKTRTMLNEVVVLLCRRVVGVDARSDSARINQTGSVAAREAVLHDRQLQLNLPTGLCLDKPTVALNLSTGRAFRALRHEVHGQSDWLGGPFHAVNPKAKKTGTTVHVMAPDDHGSAGKGNEIGDRDGPGVPLVPDHP